MKKFGFGKKGDDGGRKKSSQSSQADNPYAQQGANDPYTDSAKYANMSPYQQARAGAIAGQQKSSPSSNEQGGRPSGGNGSGNQSLASSSSYGPPSSTGYGADRYGSGGGYGSDRYNNSASGARGPGGYGGFSQSNDGRDESREAAFSGPSDRQPQGLQSSPAPATTSYTSYSQPGAGGDSYGGYGEQRELTAEEQEEAEYRAILAEKRQIQQESSSSVSRSVQMARQANEVGQATLARLGVQGERLHNTEKNLDLAANQNKVAQDRAAELKTLNRSMFAVHVGNPFTSKARQQKADEDVLTRYRSERDQREATRQDAYSSNQRMESTFKEINAADRPRPQTRKKDYGKFNLEDEDEEANRIEDDIDAGLDELGQQVSMMNLVEEPLSDAVGDATMLNRERLARIK
ncbi:serine/threonine dehydratase, pyridoxal-phosphate-binding site [Pochonia chlamydosporia 170]|uniref:Serine/threonine dehydratase, pyridoxal-phosphate-binding site n=1 Tax=Pochonia chlamydosporia 170 TaxID=1380566 RepID=A0A219APT1_METCM|nr:serine/threonine dehydratase, pyridoxal-phosphate-binding site [Pochonia chlamydosporia 170]OWT42826.1 serine/threonine dehydratase, pyridoxal-phosphate-binding site [Pochonia chlamydosporia 170]